MKRYDRKEKTAGDSKIGEGAYGVVYKALDTHLNKDVAMKKIRLEVEDEGVPATALREITLLRQIDHVNVVRMTDILMEPTRLYLVFELLDTDLKKLMDNIPGRRLEPSLLQSYAAQLLEGLFYCHSMGVMHRDLKPQNLLVARDGILKLADFGLARAFTPPLKPLTVEVVTRWYRAPEILLGSATYTAFVDMWSVGCIIAEMSNMKPLLPGDSEIDQIHRIFRLLGTPTVDVWPEILQLPYWRNTFPEWGPLAWSTVVSGLDPLGQDLLSRLLVYNSRSRLCASRALDHPFIAPFRNAFPRPTPPESLDWEAIIAGGKPRRRQPGEQLQESGQALALQDQNPLPHPPLMQQDALGAQPPAPGESAGFDNLSHPPLNLSSTLHLAGGSMALGATDVGSMGGGVSLNAIVASLALDSDQ